MRRGTVELPLAASRDSAVPLAAQIAAQLRTAMTEGQLAAGERLPASRALAAELGVSRTVINGAYAQLFAEGWIEGRHGSGTYVADGAPGTPRRPARHSKPGRPDQPRPGPAAGHPAGRYSPVAPPPGRRPRSTCGPAFPGQPASTGPPGGGPGGPRACSHHRPADPAGLAELRGALAGYLRRSRGIQCAPEEILVTRGIAGGLGLIAAALLRPGDRAGVEEPGYPVARDVLAAHGVQVVPLPGRRRRPDCRRPARRAETDLHHPLAPVPARRPGSRCHGAGR